MHKITPKSKEDRDNCMTENKYTHDVFISFSFNDQTVAEYIVNTLSSMYEISCWICTRDIAGGSRYKRLIPEAIDNAQVVVFLQSSSSIASKEVPKEIGLAMDADKIIIPFKLDSAPLTGDLRYDLYGVEYIDATVPSFDEQEPRQSSSARIANRIRLTLVFICPLSKKGAACWETKPLSFELFALNLEHFLAAVISASLANTVIHNEFAALGALRHAGEHQFPVIGASLVSASFRYFLLRYCHDLHLLEARVKTQLSFI